MIETMVVRGEDGQFHDCEWAGNLPNAPAGQRRAVVTLASGAAVAAQLWPDGWKVVVDPIQLHVI